MLVLPRAQDDQVSHPATLYECQIACSESGGVGRRGPGEHPGTPKQPSVGEAPVALPGAVGGGEIGRR